MSTFSGKNRLSFGAFQRFTVSVKNPITQNPKLRFIFFGVSVSKKQLKR
jgi:hypothetical protein